MPFNILCYGDSNTYGFTPGKMGRYPENIRWPGKLADILGEKYRVYEAGLNGRTTDIDDEYDRFLNGIKYIDISIRMAMPLDLIIIMLGSNDLKSRYNRTAEDIAAGAEKVALRAQRVTAAYDFTGKSSKILLISPPKLGMPESSDTLAFFKENFSVPKAMEESEMFGSLYRAVAEKLGAYFLDAASCTVPSEIDGLHLSVESHLALASAVAEKVMKIFK